MNEVRFGIIGGGLMGKELASAIGRWMHLDAPAVRPKLVGVCDPSPEAREWFARHVPDLAYCGASADELLDAPLDAVYVAVPHHLHRDLYVKVLESGKHLFAEKPFGIDLPAAQAIMESVRAHPDLLVRCSSEFPFYPGAQRILRMAEGGEFGEVIEVRAAFCHSSDLDPRKPINWKRRIATNGAYGCMGDLGLHVVHIPARLGWRARNVRALLSNIFHERPDGKGGMAACETWDNATLACETEQGFPMILETKRISPGDTNSWSIEILGTRNSARFTTKHPKSLWTMPYQSGDRQAWRIEDLGYDSLYPAITGHVFEFGFPDALLQMWASYVDELNGGSPPFRCATPEEALESHFLFTAALESQSTGATVSVHRG